MADEFAIRAELDSNPGLYGGLTDAQVVTELTVADKDNWIEISSAQIFEAIDIPEFQAFNDAQKRRIDRILGLGEGLKTAPGSMVRSELITLFGGGSTTASNLVAIANQPVSRAQQLKFGRVLVGDVAHARALP